MSDITMLVIMGIFVMSAIAMCVSALRLDQE